MAEQERVKEKRFMKDETVLLSKKTLHISIGIAVILMILGSFADYPLSCALYDETNPIAVFFAAYGEIPAILGWVAAGTLLAAGHSKGSSCHFNFNRVGLKCRYSCISDCSCEGC